MSTRAEKLHFAIAQVPAADNEKLVFKEDPSLQLRLCPIELPQFSLSSLHDKGEVIESSTSVFRKRKWPSENKAALQFRKFFYPRFKRRSQGIPGLELHTLSARKQQVHRYPLQELPPSLAECMISEETLHRENSSGLPVLLRDIVNCVSPANFVRGGELSEKPYSCQPCISTPTPINNDWISRLEESPGADSFPSLQFVGWQDNHTHTPCHKTLSPAMALQCISSSIAPRETKMKSILSNSNLNRSSNSNEPMVGCDLQESSVLMNVTEKENVPPASGSNSKAVQVYKSLQKTNRSRKLRQGQAPSARELCHGKPSTLQTRSCIRLNLDLCTGPMKSGPILRSSQHERLQTTCHTQKLMKKHLYPPPYGSKKSLVKALLERYLWNRRLKNGNSGTPSCRETFLPFLKREASRRVECFNCKSGVQPEETTHYTCKECKRIYHFTCAQNLKGFRFCKNGDVVCPQHVCMVCKSRSRFKVLRCEHCTVAAHKKCFAFPEHVMFLDTKPECFICWRHPQDWRLQCEYKVATADTKEAFKRLPVPYFPVEFSIGSGLHEEVSGKGLEPTPFVHIRRNIFLVKKKRDNTDDGVGCFCKDSCQDSCECRAQSMSCSKSCACNEKCANKPFRREKKIKLVKTLACGWGVQTVEAIGKGEFVMEYVGEVINEAMCEDRLWTLKERGDHNFYMCEIGKDFIIDATFKGNTSRFVNHSCDPNCNLEKWRVDGEIRVGIFAVRDIKGGEALTYDYKFVQFGSTVKCRCGSLNCRGNLGEPYQSKRSKSDVSTVIPAWGEKHKRSATCVKEHSQ